MWFKDGFSVPPYHFFIEDKHSEITLPTIETAEIVEMETNTAETMEYRGTTRTYLVDGKVVRRVYFNNRIEYYKDDQLHRENGPAVIYPDGSEEWYQYGDLHRENGPAIVNPSHNEWFFRGKSHRVDGPAIVYFYKNRRLWYRHGKLHRLDGPAIEDAKLGNEWYADGVKTRDKLGNQIFYFDDNVIKLVQIDGSVHWSKNNQFHREDGPALEYPNGTKEWYNNGLRHRIGGMAIEWGDGTGHYYLKGVSYTAEKYAEQLKGLK